MISDQSVTLNISIGLEWSGPTTLAARIANLGIRLGAGNSQQVAALDWKVPENDIRMVPLTMDPCLVEGAMLIRNII